MRIATRFRFTGLLALGLGLVAIGILHLTHRAATAARAAEARADALATRVYEITILTGDCLLWPEARARAQWWSVWRRLESELRGLPAGDGPLRGTVERATRAHAELRVAFEHLATAVPPAAAGAVAGDAAAAGRVPPPLSERNERLATQIQMICMRMLAATRELKAESVGAAERAEALAVAVPGLLVGLLLAFLGASLFALGRSIGGPLLALQAAVAAVRAGVLDVPPAPLAARTDEIGDLGRDFREMTAALRASRARVSEELGERRRAEDSVRRLNEELAARAEELGLALREMETFSYSVAHDLRAPLLLIQGFATVLEEDAGPRLSGEDRASLAQIRDGVGRMGRIIEGMLSLARLRRCEIRRQRVDLTEVARDAVTRLRTLHPQRGVHCRIEEGLACEGDLTLIQQVMQNLLDNAWKFTASTPGGGRVEVGRRDGDPPSFFVRDDGSGFDARGAPALFAPFVRLHDDPAIPGTGIGLSTVQRIVQRHGGRVAVESVPGAGTTVTFSLPALAAATPAQTPPPAPAPLLRASP